MRTPAVQVRNLQKTYDGRAVVDDVSFDIEQGETFALLGPNGAGKSTTVEILEGYRRRSGGTVSVLGVDPEHGGLEWKARLGIVLQVCGQSGLLTVREQLRQFAGFYPDARDVDEVISAVGLTAQAKMRTSKLSGGQQRRVDVAMGIIGRPELLFLDEPTTGFDPEARREFWELIRGLKADGTTILLTTHYLDEAAQLADRAPGARQFDRADARIARDGHRRRCALHPLAGRQDDGCRAGDRNDRRRIRQASGEGLWLTRSSCWPDS